MCESGAGALLPQDRSESTASAIRAIRQDEASSAGFDFDALRLTSSERLIRSIADSRVSCPIGSGARRRDCLTLFTVAEEGMILQGWRTVPLVRRRFRTVLCRACAGVILAAILGAGEPAQAEPPSFEAWLEEVRAEAARRGPDRRRGQRSVGARQVRRSRHRARSTTAGANADVLAVHRCPHHARTHRQRPGLSLCLRAAAEGSVPALWRATARSRRAMGTGERLRPLAGRLRGRLLGRHPGVRFAPQRLLSSSNCSRCSS